MRAAVLAVLAVITVPLPAAAAPPAGALADFGPSLLADCPFPEGIAIDPRGFVYASSFAFAPAANVCRLDRDGTLVATIPVPAGPGGVAALLGMLYLPSDGLYVTDFADGTAPHGRLLRIDRAGRVEEVASGFAAPNAIAVDHRGNLYVSDSFAGTITRLRPDGSGLTVWASDPRLATAGSPPFGANGLAFDPAERWLYVANTGDDAVLRIPMRADGSAGDVEVFASGSDPGAEAGALDGADGIAFDVAGDLWVCANQANEIQVLSPGGALVARHRGAGSAALDFPASLAFDGRTLYLTNLSLSTGGVNSKLSAMATPLPGAPVVR
jgi:sugar lactone lactonase YvrE